MLKFRDYQEYAIESIFKYFATNKEGHPIVAAPTGVGKSIMIAGFIQRVFQRYGGQRIMMLTHVKELIQQNKQKLLELWPTAPVGVYSAGLGRAEKEYSITYAGIASVVRIIKDFGKIDLVLIDECHLISPKQNTMYGQVLTALKEINPKVRFVGFTATPWRAGQGHLTDGGIFTDVCCDMTGKVAFNWFIDQGYLSNLIPKPTKTVLDTEGVKTSAGEYNLKQLQEAVNKDAITRAALQETLEVAQDRQRWLVFASGIEHAERVAEMLNEIGVTATCVHSKLSGKERDARLVASKAGKYRAIVNNGVLTTGYDDPEIDLILMLRPTKSTGLWVQCLGRGTRPLYASGYDLSTAEGRLEAIAAGGKPNCLVLDFAQNTRSLGPINDPVLPNKKGKGHGQAPFRVCDNCGQECHASLKECPFCLHVFPPKQINYEGASTLELVTRGNEAPVTEQFKVDKVVYVEHRKPGRPTSLKASYYCGLRVFHEWVCFEHEGFAKRKAHEWWNERGQGEPPVTVKEAFTRLNELREPNSAIVWVNKKYPEILSCEYS